MRFVEGAMGRPFAGPTERGDAADLARAALVAGAAPGGRRPGARSLLSAEKGSCCREATEAWGVVGRGI
eukprot:6095244-Alexandrium_andersonii.AAC.1